MAKLDLYKKHGADYVAPKKPALVTIPRAKYLAIEGSEGLIRRALSLSFFRAVSLSS